VDEVDQDVSAYATMSILRYRTLLWPFKSYLVISVEELVTYLVASWLTGAQLQAETELYCSVPCLSEPPAVVFMVSFCWWKVLRG
jgi:hypothetical protein